MDIEKAKQKLCQIYDEADHIVGTEAEDHKEVAIADAETIKGLAADALRALNVEG